MATSKRTARWADTILVLNSGSSSLKFGLFEAGDDDEQLLLEGSAQGIGHADGSLHIHSADGAVQIQQSHVMESQTDALQRLAAVLREPLQVAPSAVGHRIVHGGPRLREHQRITPAIQQQLRAAQHFAPLHIPQALALIQQAEEIFPGVPHFACFDNAFHRTMPPRATQLPLPRRYAEAGVIRYGFHGLSYESLVRRLGASLPPRTVCAHLGSGSSLCALYQGKSIDTSMSFTPTGGVPMSTRSGDLDPGVLLYLMRTESLDADALEKLLNQESGLAGLANQDSDMQALLQHAKAGDSAAQLALDSFSAAVRKAIGGYAALLGGLDLLVFTGGIGEHSAQMRRRICDGLQFLGIDPDLSDHADDAAGGKVKGKVGVIKAEEEKQMARHCRALLAAP